MDLGSRKPSEVKDGMKEIDRKFGWLMVGNGGTVPAMVRPSDPG
jgi:putative IMPACT (imprinted ancient) family translation regulator